ncbi:unnamed protein product, partial [Ectocarpus fasciculatus]
RYSTAKGPRAAAGVRVGERGGHGGFQLVGLHVEGVGAQVGYERVPRPGVESPRGVPPRQGQAKCRGQEGYEGDGCRPARGPQVPGEPVRSAYPGGGGGKALAAGRYDGRREGGGGAGGVGGQDQRR